MILRKILYCHGKNPKLSLERPLHRNLQPSNAKLLEPKCTLSNLMWWLTPRISLNSSRKSENEISNLSNNRMLSCERLGANPWMITVEAELSDSKTSERITPTKEGWRVLAQLSSWLFLNYSTSLLLRMAMGQKNWLKQVEGTKSARLARLRLI